MVNMVRLAVSVTLIVVGKKKIWKLHDILVALISQSGNALQAVFIRNYYYEIKQWEWQWVLTWHIVGPGVKSPNASGGGCAFGAPSEEKEMK